MADGPAARGKGKAIILVVDRDPHIRELESHFPQQAGYSVGSSRTERALWSTL